MNIETVNELIASLESAGELSIREQKFLKLAKAFKQLAAENVGLKRVPETDSVAMLLALDSFRSELLPDVGLQKAFESLMYHRMTPATDRIVAGIKADGVEMFALMFAEEAIKDNNITTGWKARASRAASEYADLLREGADK
ncbi:hypothetical protein KGG54_11605 [Klebsiella variicola subsp. variicola]|uniref:hypothetical protein n=1 Tax=Klebsiella variicola TaxID=244366 RepID=UPI001DE382ED|nr:hypothetical protein [Klebsiella variicola]MCB8420925.1 hypothetical protein [Klebsiella variicola subsp. variicola]MCB8442547.1 hypothetical protein [Klebsiella variicola subsp. variicola]MCB8496341.1 hypothetical protein [Klebsiella variicola subsp. variicola]